MPTYPPPAPEAPVAGNLLYYGDNLPILRQYVRDESVDLVYLDPPFNSNQTYNVLFQEKDGSRATSQVRAFEDTWRWDQASAAAYEELVTQGPDRVSRAMQAFRMLLGTNDMLAYLAMMAPRLLELRRALKPTGSLYLHCDSTASHYLKLLLDSVFGPERFRNEIVWKRTTAHSSAKKYAPVHDTLLYYGKTGECVWNEPRVAYEQAYLDKYYRFDDGDGRLYWRDNLTGSGIRHGESGRPWRGIDPGAIGRHWIGPVSQLEQWDKEGRIYWPPDGKMPQYKRYRDELKGRAISDIWDDIDRINPVAAERLGYPTQKPEALLERILAASSNEGDAVLDPFCGCGTAVAVAQRLGRRWVGIDITCLAIGIVRSRLRDAFGAAVEKSYRVVGEPVTAPDAEALARDDPIEFQRWVVSKLAGRPVEVKKGKDKGVDGRIYFHDGGPKDPTRQVVISVKSGKTGPNDVRDLRGVMARDGADIGVLVTLQDPTKDMKTEAASASYYEGWGRKYPRLQLLTVEEIIAGDEVQMPPRHQTSTTFKKAPKAKTGAKGTQGGLFGG